MFKYRLRCSRRALMAAKRKRSPSDEGEEEAPPLPDEPLPRPEDQPPLPDETPPPLSPEETHAETPPLPDETPPSTPEDSDEDEEFSSSKENTPNTSTVATTSGDPDAWQAVWEPNARAYYFYNTETKETTWLNPRIPPNEAAAYLEAHPPLIDPDAPPTIRPEPVPEDLYNPETGEYSFTARFNARTGKWQNNPEHTAENFSTQGQIMRTTREYFDISQMTEGKVVGKSGGALRAERRTMKIPKAQMKELIRRKREKKDRNKREWYRNDDIIVRKH